MQGFMFTKCSSLSQNLRTLTNRKRFLKNEDVKSKLRQKVLIKSQIMTMPRRLSVFMACVLTSRRQKQQGRHWRAAAHAPGRGARGPQPPRVNESLVPAPRAALRERSQKVAKHIFSPSHSRFPATNNCTVSGCNHRNRRSFVLSSKSRRCRVRENFWLFYHLTDPK